MQEKLEKKYNILKKLPGSGGNFVENRDRRVEFDQRVEGRDPDLGNFGGVGEQSEHDGFDELGLVDSSIGDTPQGQKAGHNGNFLLSNASFDQWDQFTEDLLPGQNA